MISIHKPQAETIIFGFDSAWTDNPKAPGAICAIAFDRRGRASFLSPRLVSFEQAHGFIEAKRSDFPLCLVALDQPTIVRNDRGSRPVDRVAASLVSFVGGGVQPANRSKGNMFGDDAPIWGFKRKLGAHEDPEAYRAAQAGLFLVEVFPALALPALNPVFGQRMGAHAEEQHLVRLP